MEIDDEKCCITKIRVKNNYEKVFDHLIKKYFFDDVESCMQVSKCRAGGGKEFPGGLNFTVALLIFCVIEMLAGFYLGQLKVKQEDVSKFIVKYFSKYYFPFGDVKFVEYFYNVFRHGLVHQFGPKDAAISIRFDQGKLIEKLNVNGNPHICLNIKEFYLITKEAVLDYESDLKTGDFVDNFDKRYEAMAEKNKEDNANLMGLLIDKKIF